MNQLLTTISQYLVWPTIIIQLLLALALILIIATTTTKSEQSGTGMGWGTIGGQASTSVHKFGLDAQLTRVTTILAISFFVVSFLSAIFFVWMPR